MTDEKLDVDRLRDEIRAALPKPASRSEVGFLSILLAPAFVATATLFVKVCFTVSMWVWGLW